MRLTSRACFYGWLRFLVLLVVLMATGNAAAQVFEHWNPDGQNPLYYAALQFLRNLCLQLAIGAVVSSVFFAFALTVKLRPPWMDAGR
jgi:hypothetical protein